MAKEIRPADLLALAPAERLVALIEIANAPRGWIKLARLAKMRDRFDQMKGRRTIGRCFVCSSKGQCFHHVRPISRGGSYHWINVVSLCFYCHSRVHPWLQRKME